MKSRNILFVFVLSLLVGCSAGGKKFSGLEKPEDGYAQVYVYRPSTLQQSGIYPDIELDSKLIGKLKNGGYLSIKTKPGDHKLAVTGNYLQWNHSPRSFDVNFEGGKTYFYRLQPFASGLYSPVPIGGVYLVNHNYSFLKVDDQDVALKELAKLKESVDSQAEKVGNETNTEGEGAVLPNSIVDEVKLLRKKDGSSQLVVAEAIVLKYLPIGMSKKGVVSNLKSEGFEVHFEDSEKPTLL